MLTHARSSARRLVPSLLLGLAACGGGKTAPDPFPALTAAFLTTDKTVVPTHALGVDPAHSPSDGSGLAALLAAGWGDTADGPGLALVPHTLDGKPPPAPGASPKLLIRFAHLADTQLADDESPARVASFDAMGPTNSAYRPHEAWVCRMLNAMMRTFNKLSETRPIELLLLGGDNIDNAQGNELAWFLQILDGKQAVDCDSGIDDDPIPGPGNDPKDPFWADGIAMPWRWVTGNHDVLHQGTTNIDDRGGEFVGTSAMFGTRDWSRPDGPLTTGAVPADARRAPLHRKELMARVAADGDGHGLGAAQTTSGKAFYSFDAKGGGLRFVVIDTGAEEGSSDGLIRRADFEAYVRPLLVDAEQAGLPTIIVSHHAPPSLTAGTPADDPIHTDEWRELLGSFPHVILHLAGHSHTFRARVATPASGHAFYEAETGSLADWPCEARLFEVWDQDNGTLLIRAIPVDYSVEGDPLLPEARRRAAADYTAGWIGEVAGPGPDDARAIELHIPKAP